MGELIVIVNKNDEVIGSKDRAKVSSPDIYRVSALWLTNSKGEVLLAQRKLTKAHDPGKWRPAVAGTVKDGESYEDNIYKEADEEIGLTGCKFIPGPKIFRDSENKFFCQWFLFVTDKDVSEFIPQETEVEKLAWVDKNLLFEDIRNNPQKYTKGAPTYEGLFKDL